MSGTTKMSNVVRAATHRFEKAFCVKDVVQTLGGDVDSARQRNKVSAYLSRMVQRNEVDVLEHGSGTRPTLYKRKG
jgi:ribosomal protein S17E